MKPYLTLGMTAALTGRFSGPGQQARSGVQAWIADTNRAEGLRVGHVGRRLPVRLICYDDMSRGERCAALVERLIVEDQVDILLGPYGSGLARRAAAVAERYRRVLWNHGGSSDAICASGHTWVVSVLTPASRYFHGVIDAIREAQPALERVAIVHAASGTFSREAAMGAAAYCRAQGVKTVVIYPYEADTMTFAPLLQGLHRDAPQVLLGVGRIEDDLRLAASLAGTALPLMAVGLIVTPLQRFGSELGALADGFLGPSQWEPSVSVVPDYGPSTSEVMQSLERQAATDIDYPMAQAYAGCLVVQRCLEVTGSLEPQTLRCAANQLDFTTFYGRFRIDPQSGRQIGHVMPVVQWQNRRKTIVWPPEMRQQRAVPWR